MATHSSILAWKIPWTEEPIRLQSMGSQRVGHWAISLSLIIKNCIFYVSVHYVCMYLSISHLCIYESVSHLHIYVSVCLSMYPSASMYQLSMDLSNNHLYIYLCIYVAIICVSMYLCIHPLSVYLSIYPSLYLSIIYVSICVSLCYLSQEMYLDFYFNVVLAWISGLRASLVAQTVKHLPVMRETWVRSLGGEDPLEKEMATHSSPVSWKIPWMEEPGRL